MILSKRLKEEMDKLRPEARELTMDELTLLQKAHEKLPRALGGGLSREIFFDTRNGLSHNYAAPEENARWETYGELPLKTFWHATAFKGQRVTFSQIILFSGGDMGYMDYMTRWWAKEPDVVKKLPEKVVQISPKIIITGVRDTIVCFVSEYQDFVGPTRIKIAITAAR